MHFPVAFHLSAIVTRKRCKTLGIWLLKSTTGEHYLGLDHIRAFAALLVFMWHFLHGHNGYPVLFKSDVSILVFPLALFDEGHVGVSLFMTLSGYLFTKLIGDKDIYFGRFMFNRILRLIPLLYIYLLIEWEMGGRGTDIPSFFNYIVRGLYTPTYAVGGWSVMIEMQFYLLLPLLLAIYKGNKNIILMLVLVTVGARVWFYLKYNESQSISYWYIFGRIDQFLLGMYACSLKNMSRYSKIVGAVTVVFCLLYWIFAERGGFFFLDIYPSKNPLWIIIPTIEGVAFSIIIAYYDSLKITGKSVMSRFVAKIGDYSYSIYLTHFFVVFAMADFINRRICPISNIYLAMMFGFLCFLLMIPIGYVNMKLIERPILRYRINYIRTLSAMK